ncbi:hypothetical protein L6R50_01055 [Myxococcota bacterium]|nr:hypothetical protein [Myxococcota bacterium]
MRRLDPPPLALLVVAFLAACGGGGPSDVPGAATPGGGRCHGACGDGACDTDTGEDRDCQADCGPYPFEPYADGLAAAWGAAAARAPWGDALSAATTEALGLEPPGAPGAPVHVGVSVHPTSDNVDYVEERLILDDPSVGRFSMLLLRPWPPMPGPSPALLALHGHGLGPEEMRDEFGALDLVREGYVVALPRFPSLTAEADDELLPADDLLVAGRTLMGARVAKARRGLRLLASLPEVDPTRIGVYGHSAGGILALFVGLVDETPRALLTDWDAAPGRTQESLVTYGASADNYLPGFAGLGEWEHLLAGAAEQVPVVVEEYGYPGGIAGPLAVLAEAIEEDGTCGDSVCGGGESAADCAADCGGVHDVSIGAIFEDAAADLVVDADAAALSARWLRWAVRRARDPGPGDPRPALLRAASAVAIQGSHPWPRDVGCAPAGAPPGATGWVRTFRDPGGAKVRARVTDPGAGPGGGAAPVVVLLKPQLRLPSPGEGWSPADRRPTDPEVTAALASRGLVVVEPALPGSDPTDPGSAPLLPYKLLLVGTSLPAVWSADLSRLLDVLGTVDGDAADTRGVAVVAWGGLLGAALNWALDEPRVRAVLGPEGEDPLAPAPGWSPLLRLPGGADAFGPDRIARALQGRRIVRFRHRSDGRPRDPAGLAAKVAGALERGPAAAGAPQAPAAGATVAGQPVER